MSNKTNVAPEAHPNYRPPADMPPLELGAPAPLRDDPSSSRRCCFVVSDLLTPSECSDIVSAAERAGMSGVDWEYHPSYRSCRRVVFRSRPLADAVYARLLPLLSDAECERVRPFGFDGDGDWRPCKVNEVVRVSGYDVGDRFERHRDGAFVENDDVRSVYTVLAYLNGPPEFEGGVTSVFPSPSKEGEDVGARVAVVPRTGAALVMTHDTEHAGEVVTSGRKYVARFDLMFRRLGGSMTEAELAQLPNRALAERLYRSSVEKQRDGDPRGSTEDYVRALSLQARLSSSSDGDDDGPGGCDAPLDEDSFVRALRFLEPSEIARASETCRRWRSACASGLLWRELFVLRWPTLLPGESLVLSRGDPCKDDEEARPRIPPAVYGDTVASSAAVAGGRSRRWHHVAFVAMLPQKGGSDGAPFRAAGRDELRKALYRDWKSLPEGYMYSCLNMSDASQVVRLDDKVGWKRFRAHVRSGAIHFAEYEEARTKRWPGRRTDAYDASKDVRMDVPPPVPIEHDTDISFSFRSDVGKRNKYSRSYVDLCVIKLPQAIGGYMVICQHDPRDKILQGESYFPSHTFAGIMEDIARLVVGRQTEAALRYGNVVVKADAKTKQWKTAYTRRHVAEKFFDVVTIDIGQRQTKFTANGVTANDILQKVGFQNEATMHSFFVRAIHKYHGIDESRWVQGGLKSIRGFAMSGQATSMVDKAMKDPEMWHEIPPFLMDANHGCGSIASLVGRSRGHLWSAGHGLLNHVVGDECIELDHATAPFDADGEPNCDAMSIICAHVVGKTFVRRVFEMYSRPRATVAEHPVNVVEPALGFAEEVKTRLVSALACFHVPFVGFVNGAEAALMCGEEPRRDGVVVSLGGVNSAVVPVVDGVADVSRGVRLALPAEENVPDDPFAIADEAGCAVRTFLAPEGGAAANGLVPVLLTGGRASDAVLAAMRSSTHNAHFYTASREGERHLDACRGAHILANLSDGRKHFKTVLHTMWSL